MEDLAERDATEKSDAAREAFLAELALDSKKGNGGGTDNSRHMHEKTKDKKKNKEFRKTKDPKVLISWLCFALSPHPSLAALQLVSFSLTLKFMDGICFF